MRDWADAIVALLLAPTCGACHQPLARPTRGCVCEACWEGVGAPATPLCLRCGDDWVDGLTVPHADRPSHSGDIRERRDDRLVSCAHCVTVPASIERARAIGPYAGTLRDILHALKYDGRRSLGIPLGHRMRLAGADLLGLSDCVVPVPLHPRRRRERGFNQAADLSHHLGLPVVHALRRQKSTPTQTMLHAKERHDNMREAFALTRQGDGLRGASVLLVDDVRTTGATLDACALALKGAGVRVVFALTAARVESSRLR